MAKRAKRTQAKPPARIAAFTGPCLTHLRYWIATDPRVALRILDLVDAVMRDPFRGLGKPEPLRHLAITVWSRRITQEHRLVYLVRDERIDFLMARYHY